MLNVLKLVQACALLMSMVVAMVVSLASALTANASAWMQ